MAVIDSTHPPVGQPSNSQGSIPLPPVTPYLAEHPTYQYLSTTSVASPSHPPISAAEGIALGGGLVLLGLLVGIVWMSRRG